MPKKHTKNVGLFSLLRKYAPFLFTGNGEKVVASDASRAFHVHDLHTKHHAKKRRHRRRHRHHKRVAHPVTQDAAQDESLDTLFTQDGATEEYFDDEQVAMEDLPFTEDNGFVSLPVEEVPAPAPALAEVKKELPKESSKKEKELPKISPKKKGPGFLASLQSTLPLLLDQLFQRLQKLEKAVSFSSKEKGSRGALLSAKDTKKESIKVNPADLVLEEDSKLKSAAKSKEENAEGTDALLAEMNQEKEEGEGLFASKKKDEIAPALPSDELMHPEKSKKPAEREVIVLEEPELPPVSKTKDKPLKKEVEKKVEEKKPVEEAPLPKIIIKTRKRRGGFSEFLSSFKYFGMKKEGVMVIQSLATMLNAGLPLVDSLKALQKETRIKGMKKMLQRVIDAVDNGSALWRALDEQEFFSPHAIALIRIGEEAGNLAQNMEYLALQQEKDNQLKSKVKMAMIYPTIVLVLMFLIVMGLGMFVLPNLIQVLYSLHVKLPLVTRIVIKFTNFFTNYGKVAIPGSIVGLFVLIVLAKFSPLKVVFQWIMFRIPGIGRLAKEATIARFGVILGGLLQAGVPMIDAIRSLVEVTPILSYRRFYVHLLEHITIGDSFAKSFATIHKSEKILPISVQQLIMTGEKSGSLAKIMLKVSDIYEKKANDTAQKLPVILEPMLLLFIGALVGTIALAIIVPIYSIVGNVGRG